MEEKKLWRVSYQRTTTTGENVLAIEQFALQDGMFCAVQAVYIHPDSIDKFIEQVVEGGNRVKAICREG